jgi:hypothetical protein
MIFFNEMTRPQLALLVLLAAGVVFFTFGMVYFLQGHKSAEKFLSTSSSLIGISSILQLKISGWFDSVLEKYGDADKYPYGPPV